jgi:hypothetical protein
MGRWSVSCGCYLCSAVGGRATHDDVNVADQNAGQQAAARGFVQLAPADGRKRGALWLCKECVKDVSALATASPAAIVAAASSEDAEALSREQAENRSHWSPPRERWQTHRGDPTLLDVVGELALARAAIVDQASHVVLPRAEVEEWIVGLRSYNDDCMFDYMPPALRELLGEST